MKRKDAIERFRNVMSEAEQRELDGRLLIEELRAGARARAVTEEYEAFIRSRGEVTLDMPEEQWE